jgi:hypothetical protein
MAPRKAPTFDGKNTVCGPGYTFKCPGTRECYYGNNLGTYLDTCERKNINLAGYSLKRIRSEEQPQEWLAELSFLE